MPFSGIDTLVFYQITQAFFDVEFRRGLIVLGAGTREGLASNGGKQLHVLDGNVTLIDRLLLDFGLLKD